MEQIDFMVNAAETRRFHTMPVLRTQNIAEHSWSVAMLVWIIYGQAEPGIRMPVLMAALTHDMAEHKVGDIPSPAKRDMEKRLELKGTTTFRKAWNDMEQDILKSVSFDWEDTLTVEELDMLALCDSLSGALYCVRERAMGNTLIYPAFMNYDKYINETLGERPKESDDAALNNAWEVYDYINTQWELSNGR